MDEERKDVVDKQKPKGQASETPGTGDMGEERRIYVMMCKKGFLNLLLLTAVAAAVAVPAQAGVITVDKHGDKTYYQGGLTKSVSSEAGEPWNVIDLDKGTMTEVDSGKRTYTTDTFDGYCKTIKRIFGPMLEEQRRAGLLKDKAPKVNVRKTGSGGRILGYKTVKYMVFADGKPYEEVWLTTDASLFPGMTKKQMKNMEKLSSCMGMFGSDVDNSPEYMKLIEKGLELKSFNHEMGTTAEIVRLEKRKIPPSEFKVPKGYKRVTIAEMMGMGPPPEEKSKPKKKKAVGNPVAPYPPDSALTETGKLMKRMKQSGEEMKVPSKEEVGVPIYPGAYLSSTSSGSGLPMVTLLSADPPEKVTAWYKDNLKGWSYNSLLKVFYEGPDKLPIGKIMERPQVVIVPGDKDVLFGMYDIPVKTSFSITYKLKK